MQTKSQGNTETKTIRISYEAYTGLSKLGTLEDSFDSVIRNLLSNQGKSDREVNG